MTYDIVTIGGGLAGSALAKSMAERGRRVLVLESETAFRDRVRGEQLATWGAAAAQDLGILDLLLSECGHELAWWDIYMGGAQVQHRSLKETTPQQLSNITFFHPRMQETLIAAAAKAGADVRRGARVRGVTPGEQPAVTAEIDGREERFECRLVVGCDGRNSAVRRWAGMEAQQDPDFLQIGGILVDGLDLPEDAAHLFLNPALGIGSPIFPQGGGRARMYFVSRVGEGAAHSGEKDLPAFLEGCYAAGLARSALKSATFSGPLATFKGRDVWVDHPYRDGVALVGDAAGHSDPSWGQGLSMTLHDVRLLRDALLDTDDWRAAGDAYATARNEAFQRTRAVEGWFAELFFRGGPEGDELRARALPGIVQDPTRVPDHFQAGPYIGPTDDSVRRRLFGEE